MKGRTSVSISLFTRTEGTKVFCRLGNNIGPQFHNDTACGLAANGDIKVALWVGPVF